MSEYKITIYRSARQHLFKRAFWFVCLLSLLLWPRLLQWQWVIQLSLFVLIIRFISKQCFSPGIENELVLSDNGDVQLYTEQGESLPFKLRGQSVCSDWFCYLVLLPDTLPGATGKTKRLWVFNDAVDQQSYRRLCRTILRVHRGS